MKGGIYFLKNEFYTLKSLAEGKKLTLAEELAIQHILVKMRELNNELLLRRSDNARK